MDQVGVVVGDCVKGDTHAWSVPKKTMLGGVPVNGRICEVATERVLGQTTVIVTLTNQEARTLANRKVSTGKDWDIILDRALSGKGILKVASVCKDGNCRDVSLRYPIAGSEWPKEHSWWSRWDLPVQLGAASNNWEWHDLSHLMSRVIYSVL